MQLTITIETTDIPPNNDARRKLNNLWAALNSEIASFLKYTKVEELQHTGTEGNKQYTLTIKIDQK